MTNTRRYDIDGKTYIQRPLVLGQIRQLSEAMEGLALAPEITIPDLIRLADDRLATMLAVVLTPEDMRLQDKDLAALAEELRYTIPVETVTEVIDDFFALTPVAGVLNRLAGVMAHLPRTPAPTGSPTPA